MSPPSGVTAPRPDEWPTYGNDPGGTRYSPLSQIDRGNVAGLRVAWTYRTGETGGARPYAHVAFEATPLMVEGALYLSTPYNRVIALDAETGAQRWVFDAKVDPVRRLAIVTSRGVSTWLDPAAGRAMVCRRRIFVATIDARLIALDAADGAPCADFGRRGTVDLRQGIAVIDIACCYQVTSPPAIVNGLVVVGSSIGDNRSADMERGVVRAYDARTGALRWTLGSRSPRASRIPRARPGRATAGARTGAANVWSVISVDAERGLVFVPTSSPSPDYYGGERLGANRYANSVVALRAAHRRGRLGLPGRAPRSLGLRRAGAARAGRPSRATAGRCPRSSSPPRWGTSSCSHRETGEPLFPVEERPVPQSTVAGEEACADAAVPRPSTRAGAVPAHGRRCVGHHARGARGVPRRGWPACARKASSRRRASRARSSFPASAAA